MGEQYTSRSVTNPLDETFYFKWDNVPYEIPARKTIHLAGFLAVHAAKHLAYKILIGSGRLHDTIKADGKIAAGQALPRGEAESVAMALLDRDGESLNVKEILALARNAMSSSRDLPAGIPVAEINSPEKEIATENLSPEKQEFVELKKIGFVKLDGESKKRYKELKAKLA